MADRDTLDISILVQVSDAGQLSELVAAANADLDPEQVRLTAEALRLCLTTTSHQQRVAVLLDSDGDPVEVLRTLAECQADLARANAAMVRAFALLVLRGG